MKTFKTYATKTRKAARNTVKVLKCLGFKPSTPTKKSGAGWLVATHKKLTKPTAKKRYAVVNNQVVLPN